MGGQVVRFNKSLTLEEALEESKKPENNGTIYFCVDGGIVLGKNPEKSLN